MHHLEMPQALAGPGIQGQQSVGEQICAAAIHAVEIVFRARGGRVDNSACLVDGELAPDIRSAHAIAGILRPRVIPEFTGARNGMERPGEISRANIKCADIARRRTILLICGGTENQKIFKHPARRGGLHQANALGVAIQSLFQIHAACVAKSENQPARPRINGVQKMVARKQQPPVLPVFALPVVDSAIGDDGGVRFRGMRPNLGAGGGVQRDDGIVPGQNVHHAVYDDGVEGVRIVVAGRIAPGHFELTDIGAIDLRELRILSRIRSAPVVAPACVGDSM